MSYVHENQPDGTPTWVDLGIPDLDRAMEFYGAVLEWEFDVGPEEYGRYTTCLLGGRKAAALTPNHDPAATEFWWHVRFEPFPQLTGCLPKTGPAGVPSRRRP